mmetsp:Transcript_36330/g.79830  ORF Transcript_36330/g.79830 Transcript_36330/m.79830 type:complete len:323 (-) Transcript_36330:424-1392(-)
MRAPVLACAGLSAGAGLALSRRSWASLFGLKAWLGGAYIRSMSYSKAETSLPIYQIDAFSSVPFRGNPAAVCVLDAWLPDQTLLNIAAENNLSETAFIVPRASGYDLRWFTPSLEVDMCGHATLASGALVLCKLQPGLSEARFETRSGTLVVRRGGDGDGAGGAFTLDVPLWPVGAASAPPDGIVAALGAACNPIESYSIPPLHGAPYYLLLYKDEAAIRALTPVFDKMCANVVATAPGEGEFDFVSRFFGPHSGIPEDPVTGSAHCTLAPFWAARLRKRRLRARQLSARGGELDLAFEGERLLISGAAAFYLEGNISVPVG